MKAKTIIMSACMFQNLPIDLRYHFLMIDVFTFQEQQCFQSSSNRQISESYGVWWQMFSGAAMLPEQLEPADIWKLRSLMTDVFRSSNAPRAAHNKRKYSPYHRRNHNWWVQWSCDRNFWIIDIKHENNIFSATVPSQKSDLMHWVPPITVTLTLQKKMKITNYS